MKIISKYIKIFTVCSLMFSCSNNTLNQVNSSINNNSDYGGINNQLNSNLILGLVSFNEEVKQSVLATSKENNKDNLISFVDSSTKKDGTAMYYGVYRAAKEIEKSKDSGLSGHNVYIITFTDGDDNVSGALYNKENNSNSSTNDTVALKTKSIIDNKDITSIGIGLSGNSGITKEKIEKSLSKITTVTPIVGAQSQDIESYFDRVINSITKSNFTLSVKLNSNFNQSQMVSISIPVTDGNSKENLTLEGSWENFAGSISYKIVAISLDNKTSYVSQISEQKRVIKGTREDIKEVIQINLLDYIISTQNWFYDETRKLSIKTLKSGVGESWQNLEASSGQTIVEAKSIIFLVFDASSSLGDDFDKIKSYVKNFVNKIFDSLK